MARASHIEAHDDGERACARHRLVLDAAMGLLSQALLLSEQHAGGTRHGIQPQRVLLARQRRGEHAARALNGGMHDYGLKVRNVKLQGDVELVGHASASTQRDDLLAVRRHDAEGRCAAHDVLRQCSPAVVSPLEWHPARAALLAQVPTQLHVLHRR